MQRILWVGVAVLAGLGVWLFTSSWPSGRGSGDEAATGAESGPGRSPGALAPTLGASGAESANPADPRGLPSPGAATHVASPDGSSRSGARPDSVDDEFAREVEPGARASARRSAGPSDLANATPGAGADDRGAPADLSGAAVAEPNAGARPIRSGFDDDARSGFDEASDPIADEVVIDYLARRSLGADPTPEELSERRGWAATLLSGESQEVRDQLKAQARDAAAPQ